MKMCPSSVASRRLQMKRIPTPLLAKVKRLLPPGVGTQDLSFTAGRMAVGRSMEKDQRFHHPASHPKRWLWVVGVSGPSDLSQTNEVKQEEKQWNCPSAIGRYASHGHASRAVSSERETHWALRLPKTNKPGSSICNAMALIAVEMCAFIGVRKGT